MALERIRPRSGQLGMSLVEAVLAVLIMLLIAVGILPVFTRSMSSNVAGSDSTYVSNMATERAEEFLQLPFDSDLLRLPDGATTRVFNEVYIQDETGDEAGTEHWMDGVLTDVASTDRAVWTRTTTIRQYAITDLTSPIPGIAGTDPQGTVHMKEIEVEVEGLREGGAMGRSKDLTVRVLKAP